MSNMKIIVKKTTELSELEQYKILDLFNNVFKKNNTIERFRHQFFNTIIGYSYHVILYDDDIIAGCISYIPSYYLIKEKKYLAVQGADSMVRKDYRGIKLFKCHKDMRSSVNEYMRNDGVVFIIGFPNDTSYLMGIKTGNRRKIGELNVYALPYRIGGIKLSLKIFNWLSIVSTRIYLFFNLCFASSKIYRFTIEKDLETYKKYCYYISDNKYILEEEIGGGFIYRIMMYHGTIRAAFLIDVFEKSERNFIKAINYIIKKHSKEFDILIYVGRLPFKFNGLVKIPQFFMPRKFRFTGRILQDNVISEDVFFVFDNWDINLSNFDLAIY